jgi:hypothetical protein
MPGMLDSLRGILAADPRIVCALAFGSAARGTSHAHSDVDVAIALAPDVALDATELGASRRGSSRRPVAASTWCFSMKRRRDWRTGSSGMAASSSCATRLRSPAGRRLQSWSTSTSSRSIPVRTRRAPRPRAWSIERLAAAAGFRNLMAHRYGALDWARVHQIASTRLDDPLAFCEALAQASNR